MHDCNDNYGVAPEWIASTSLDQSDHYDGSNYYNTRIKIYPDGRTVVTYCDARIFRADREHATPTYIDYTNDPRAPEDIFGEVLQKDRQSQTYRENFGKENAEENAKKHAIRAKNRLFDIVYCNRWDYFLTVTINKAKLDSRDPLEVMCKLGKWLNNQQQRRGLQYVLVPEYHKRSGRIHAHALINGVFDAVDSGTRIVEGYSKPVKLETIRRYKISPDRIWRTVYNIPAWTYGYSTAIAVYGDIARCAGYICKYMAKDGDKIFGKYYWSSRDLIRAPEILLVNMDFRRIDAPVYSIPAAGLTLKYQSNIILKDYVGKGN